MKHPVFLNFFTKLFDLDGGGVVPYLPYLVTALFLGLILAAVYLALGQKIEAYFLLALHEKGATAPDKAVPLGELPVVRQNKLRLWVRWYLRSPACSLYRSVSNEVLDARTYEDFHKKKGSKIALTLTPDTRFYILPERLAYVEERGMHFGSDAVMHLIYTVLACAFLWFITLWLLPTVVNLF